MEILHNLNKIQSILDTKAKASFLIFKATILSMLPIIGLHNAHLLNYRKNQPQNKIDSTK